MSSKWRQHDAQRLTPIAVFVVLAGLLLLTLPLPCPHGAGSAQSAESITAAAEQLSDVRAAAACATVSGQLGAAARSVECPRPDDGSDVAVAASPVGERDAWAAPTGDAVVALEPDRPHGRALLVLLGIERK